MTFSPIPEILDELRAGRPIILVDDPNRENEGDLCFAAEFATLGPADPRGRSLRALDLRTRLFALPCSFLIYGDGFAALPAEVRQRFWTRLDAVLAGHDRSADFAHLGADDRAAIRGILAATHPGAPPNWRQ